MKSVIENYHVIISVLVEIIEEYRGTGEIQSKIISRRCSGCHSKIAFLFGIAVAEKLFFSVTDTLSNALQEKSICKLVTHPSFFPN